MFVKFQIARYFITRRCGNHWFPQLRYSQGIVCVSNFCIRASIILVISITSRLTFWPVICSPDFKRVLLCTKTCKYAKYFGQTLSNDNERIFISRRNQQRCWLVHTARIKYKNVDCFSQ